MTKTTETGSSVFTKRIEQVKRNKYETEVLKYVYGFPDDHDNDANFLVGFTKTKLYKLTNF